MTKLVGVLILFILASTFAGCSSPAATQEPVTPDPTVSCEGRTITFGEISDDPDEVITSVLPFATYMADHLSAFGIDCGKVKVVDTVDEMIALIKDGEVDIYMDSMYPATLVSNATDAQPILRRWRNCDEEYFSVIFTTTSSNITTVEDLSGHMIAMDRTYSTSGLALPAVYLIDHGLNLTVKDSYSEVVAENEVGIYLSLDDKNTLNLVLEGKVDAGATDDYFFEKWEKEAREQDPPITLVKLAESTTVPRQAVLVSPSLESGLREAIKKELATAHLDPLGISVMDQAAKTCLFDDTPEGIEAAFEQMAGMHAKIYKIPGWEAAFQKGH